MCLKFNIDVCFEKDLVLWNSTFRGLVDILQRYVRISDVCLQSKNRMSVKGYSLHCPTLKKACLMRHHKISHYFQNSTIRHAQSCDIRRHTICHQNNGNKFHINTDRILFYLVKCNIKLRIVRAVMQSPLTHLYTKTVNSSLISAGNRRSTQWAMLTN
jgi:hypothetical protein